MGSVGMNDGDENKDNSNLLKFLSLEKLKNPIAKETDEKKGLEWGRGKERGKEEWRIGEEVDLSSNITLTSSDYSFSDDTRIKELNGVIIHNGNYNREFCIINKELNNVFFEY